jgi:hypothetical protein
MSAWGNPYELCAANLSENPRSSQRNVGLVV